MSVTRWGETRAKVLAYLVREADMDGLVTVAEREVGAAVGIETSVVSYHIARLSADGLLTVNLRAAQGVNAIQLAESVYA